MISDVFSLTGFGLIDPILAIFIKENLEGGTVFTAGLAAGLFLITKSLVQIPFSLKVDQQKNKIPFLLAGMIIVTLVPLIYIFSQNIYWIYVAQILHGLGAGLAFPAWLGLWSVSLDKGRESFEWSFYSTITSVGMAITGALGGALAQFVGFRATFAVVSLLSFIGCLILLRLTVKRA